MSYRNFILSSEYTIADSVPTDRDPVASAIITLSEDALQWQKMESESESEEDFPGEAMETSAAFLAIDEGHYDGFGSGIGSASSASDSDEEFTLPYYKRRGEARGGRGGRRGRSGRTSAKSAVTTAHTSEVVGYKPVSYPTTAPPPPLLSSVNIPPPRLLGQSEASPLPKTSKDTHLLKEVKVIRTGSHIQPPPGLIMPSASSSSHVDPPPALIAPSHVDPPPGLIAPSHVDPPSSLIAPSHVDGAVKVRRQPPPLVKKVEASSSPSTTQPQIYHPQIVLPATEGDDPTHRTNPQAPPLRSAGPTPSPSMVAVSAPNSSAASSPVKRRPGRPRKDQALNANSHTKKTARTVQLGLNKSRQKPQPLSSRGGGGGRSQGGRGQGGNSPALMKSMKLTQYEFQSQQGSGLVGSGLVGSGQTATVLPQQQLSTQHVVLSPATPSQQYQPLILTSSGATAGGGSPVAPLQFIQTQQAGSPVQMQTFSTVPQGGMICLQGSTPTLPQEQPTYVSKDGQLYQLIQPVRAVEEMEDNTQKISVIMQPPPQVSGTTGFIQAGDVGAFRYVTQLDGLPPKTSQTGSTGKAELRRKFESVRRDVGIWQLGGLDAVRPSRRPRGEEGGGGGGGGGGESKKRDRRISQGESSESRSCDAGGRSCDVAEGAELRMSGHVTCGVSNSNNNCNEGVSLSLSAEEGEEPLKKRGRGKSKKAHVGSALPPKSRRGQRGRKRGHGLSDAESNQDKEKSSDVVLNTPTPEATTPTPEATTPTPMETTPTSEEGGGPLRGPGRGRGRGRGKDSVSTSFRCEECDLDYTTKGGFISHMNTKHCPDLSVSIHVHVSACACMYM